MAYEPKKEDRFTFGLWCTAYGGREVFGKEVRPALDPLDNIRGLAACGCYGFRQGFARVFFIEQNLALQIAPLDEIAIDDAHTANSCPDNEIGQGSAQGPTTDDGHRRRAQPLLSLFADFRKKDLPGITFTGLGVHESAGCPRARASAGCSYGQSLESFARDTIIPEIARTDMNALDSDVPKTVQRGYANLSSQ